MRTRRRRPARCRRKRRAAADADIDEAWDTDAESFSFLLLLMDAESFIKNRISLPLHHLERVLSDVANRHEIWFHTLILVDLQLVKFCTKNM